jgi:hypothetical protein
MSKSKPFTAKELKSLIRQYKSKNCLPYSKLNRDGLIKYILNVKKLKDVYTKLKSKKTGKKDQSQITEFLQSSPEPVDPVPVDPAPEPEPEPEPKKQKQKQKPITEFLQSDTSKMSWANALKIYGDKVGKYIIPKKGTAEYKKVKAIQMLI